MKCPEEKTKVDITRERGAAVLEYGLLVALIAAVIVVAIGATGIDLGAVLSYVKDKLAVLTGGPITGTGR